MDEQWLAAKKAYIKGLKSPSVQQQVLVLLADKKELSKDEKRKLAALVRAEKAAERFAKAKADAMRLLNAEKKTHQKVRNRELFQAAGLLILADLVDGKTGLPKWEKAELLGGLLSLASTAENEEKRQAWKAKGEAFFKAKMKEI